MHLMINKKCDHDCPLCCNKLYDLDKIPVATVEELKTVHTVCITGGEPFFANIDINALARNIREQYENVKDIFVYTSGRALFRQNRTLMLSELSGVNIAPKNHTDWSELEYFENNFYRHGESRLIRSLKMLQKNRLYVFKDQIDEFKRFKNLPDWYNLQVIYRIWEKEFKTPDNEIFRRLPIFL